MSLVFIMRVYLYNSMATSTSECDALARGMGEVTTRTYFDNKNDHADRSL